MENPHGSIDKLCQDCDRLFDQHTVEIIRNSPAAPFQGSPKEHLRYQMLQISAQACVLCKVILENVLLLLGKSSECKVGGDDMAVYVVAGRGMLSFYAGDVKLRLQDMELQCAASPDSFLNILPNTYVDFEILVQEHCNLYLAPLSSQKIENIVQRRIIDGAVPRSTTIQQI